jgi:hypothetical protein
VGPAAGQAQQARQVLLGPIFPARAPDAFVGLREAGQTLPRFGGDQVGNAVHDREAPGGRFGLVEAEKGDDSVNVDQEERRGSSHRLGSWTIV